MNIEKIIEKAEQEHNLNQSQVMALLKIPEKSSNVQLLFDASDRTREKYVGDEIHLRALIEFSNYCKKNCLYCGIRAKNKKAARYRIPVDEIINIAGKAVKLGYKTVVLQSGEDNYYDEEKLVYLISKLKSSFDIAVTLCAGELAYSTFDKLVELGLDRYLLRIETTDRKLFKKLHPDDDFDTRLQTLIHLKNKGIQVGTGVLIGLPGQTLETLASDLLFYKKYDFDMVGQGPFVSDPHTPLSNEKSGDVFLSLKVIAITRLLCPDIHIPATTALITLGKQGIKEKAFKCGANVLMPNVTPDDYMYKYALYPEKSSTHGLDNDSIESVRKLIKSIGRKTSQGYGHRQ